MRKLVLALAVVLAVRAGAFEIGTGELGPALGDRRLLMAAAGADAYLVAWLDGREGTYADTLYVARIRADGSIADPEGVRIARTVGLARVASDGATFLVVARAPSGELFASQISEDEAAEPRVLAVRGDVAALAWNGRHYVALIRGSRTGTAAILLGAEGREASGLLPLAGVQSEPALACRAAGCMVLATDGGQVRGAAIDEAMFPAPGQTFAPRDVPVLFDGAWVTVAALDGGYVSVTASETRLVVRRHFDAPVARAKRRAAAPAASGYDVPIVGGSLRIVRSAPALTVAYQTFQAGARYDAIATLGAGGASVQVLSDDPPWGETPRAFAAGPAGVLAVRDAGTQLWFGLGGSAPWSGAGTLLTRSRAAESRPRAARGSASILASWVEWRGAFRVFCRILDRDGRPATPAVRIAEAAFIRELLVAFDGVHYLVVWESVDAVHGRFVAQDGALVGEPFRIADSGGLGSLLWNGSAYAVTVRDQLLHIGTSGIELGRGTFPVGWDDHPVEYLFVEYHAPTRQYSGFAARTRPSGIAVPPNEFAEYQPVTMPDDLRWAEGCCKRGRTFWAGWSSTAPAIALHFGAGFAMVFDYGGFVLAPYEKLPFSQGHAFPTRLHAEAVPGGFVVAAGRTLSRHDLDGRVLATGDLAPDATDSFVVADGDAVVALFLRGARIEALRIEGE